MDVKSIKSFLTKFNSKERTSILKLYFIEKKRQSDKKIKYFSYSANIEDEIKDELLKIAINSIEYCEGKEIIQYEPLGSLDDTIEFCRLDYISNFDIMMDALKEENNLNAMPNINNIHSYCIHFQVGNEEVFMFRRFNKLRRLRKGLIGYIKGEQFKRLDGALIGLYSDVDIIVGGNKVYILNHIALERIFDINDQFKEKAKITLDIIKEQDKIENFDKFEEDALNNITVIKRLTKIEENNVLPKVFNNFHKVEEVIKRFELNIELNPSKDKIVYVDKTQIENITLLMNDAYYATVIGGEDGVDSLK